MASDLYGIGVALVTPFTEQLEIDYSSLDKVLGHVIKGGVDYLVVCGTTGESATLGIEEKSSLLSHIKKKNRTNLPIVYGIGGNNTHQCIKEIEATDLSGISAILSVSPYYNKPSQKGILKHFEALADQSPIPIILYNVPGRTSSNLSWQTTVELSKHPNITGIKEASGDLEQCMRIISNANPDFTLISGDDLLTGPILSIGGKGVISVMANAFPAHFKAINDASVLNDYEKVSNTLFKLMDINPLMYAEGNPVGIKEVLYQMGISLPHVRLPLEVASKSLKKAISNHLRHI
jgi:4-hydroxy-tetrahydrodipicolinate synthase